MPPKSSDWKAQAFVHVVDHVTKIRSHDPQKMQSLICSMLLVSGATQNQPTELVRGITLATTLTNPYVLLHWRKLRPS